MTDIIRLLPDHIANQIAAGEVVQRPASVVKELLENAVDAGSTAIRLIVKEAGKNLIQVIDNGCGMSETDARMSFERHATSKIRELNDLFKLYTLGFRGEALASIAAVAQVELRTKRKIDEVGVLLAIDNSEVREQGPISTPDGTSICVKNLFFNVPARRNFLKKNQIELRHITDEFLRVALANPDIQFVFHNENEEVFHLRAGNLKQRIVAIWGKRYEDVLVPIEETTDMIRIKGFIGKPEAARKSRGAEQFFFANNRYIRSAYLNHAVSTGYENLLPTDSFPFYVIFMDLPPERMDINVHPTKTEIKFEDEKSIYMILRTSVRRCLSQYMVAPMLNFENERSIPLPEKADEGKLRLQTPGEISGGYSSGTTFSGRGGSNSGSARQSQQSGGSSSYSGGNMQKKASPGDWEALYEVLKKTHTPEKENLTEEEEETAEELLEAEESQQKPVLQLHRKFIVSSIRSGMIVLNQQLAHERILYERYLNLLEQNKGFSQRLLFPEVIHLPPQDFEMAKEILDDIKTLGFDLEIFGKNAFLINGIPMDLKEGASKGMLEKLIEDYKNQSLVEKLEKRDSLARALARTASIKPGKVLQYEEMKALIDELFACSVPYFSPDGRPTIITISSDELDRKFKQ